MTNNAGTNKDRNEAGSGPETAPVAATPARHGTMRTLQLLPGLAAMSLYMMLLAGINIVGVVTGQARPAYLVFSAVFIAAGLGLLMLFRWAWALTLAAVVLLVVPTARRGSETWALSKLPLGTFLCIGGIVSSLWGQPMIAAYLRWAGV